MAKVSVYYIMPKYWYDFLFICGEEVFDISWRRYGSFYRANSGELAINNKTTNYVSLRVFKKLLKRKFGLNLNDFDQRKFD